MWTKQTISTALTKHPCLAARPVAIITAVGLKLWDHSGVLACEKRVLWHVFNNFNLTHVQNNDFQLSTLKSSKHIFNYNFNFGHISFSKAFWRWKTHVCLVHPPFWVQVTWPSQRSRDTQWPGHSRPWAVAVNVCNRYMSTKSNGWNRYGLSLQTTVHITINEYDSWCYDC